MKAKSNLTDGYTGTVDSGFALFAGDGAKSAQRMAFHLLQRQRQQGLHLAGCLKAAMESLGIASIATILPSMNSVPCV